MSAEDAAGWLAEAWETGHPMAPFPPGLAPADRTAGEAVAAALVARLGIAVCGVRLAPGPGGVLISAPLLEPRMRRAGAAVTLAALRHATLSAGVLGVLAEPLGDGPPVFASLHPAIDVAAWRFAQVPDEVGAMVADLGGLGQVLVGKRAAGPLPAQAEARIGLGGTRPRPIQERLGALMDEAAAEARRWGGLPAGAALLVAGLGGTVPAVAGQRYAAAVAGVGRINVTLEA